MRGAALGEIKQQRMAIRPAHTMPMPDAGMRRMMANSSEFPTLSRRSEAVSEAIQPVLFPIGFPLGYTFRPDLDLAKVDRDTPIKSIRLGSESITIDIVSYLIWTGAFSHHERNQLIEWAKPQTPAEVVPRLDQLIEDGLLEAVTPDVASLRKFFGRYRLMPTAIGLGNSRGEQLTFTIGYRDSDRLDIDVIGYSIWAMSGRCQSTLNLIRDLNRDWAKKEDELLLHFFSVLPGLLDEGLAVLDLP